MEDKTKMDLKHWEEQLHHIFYHEKFTFCLLCVDSIQDNLLCIAEDLAHSHLLSSEHKNNAKSLFKMCISDPLCDSTKKIHKDIVENSVFDISLLLCDEPSYITQCDEHFVCLVCQSQLCKVSDDQRILLHELIRHLRSEFHLQNIKDNVCWVYRQNAGLDFVMFYKSVVYCSSCKQTIKITENSLLCTIVSHLQTLKHKTNQTPNSNKGISAKKAKVSKKFKTFTIADDGLQSGSKVLEVHVPPEEDSSTESYYSCVDSTITCPDCREIIEIYNENVEFSIQLHSQKHKDLSRINHIIGQEFQEHTDYVCPFCQENIQIFNKNIELSVNRHFENCHQSQKGDDFTENNDYDGSFHFVNIAFSKLPKSLEAHRSYVTMDNNEMFCKLCNYKLLSGKDVLATSEMLKNHLLSNYHVQQHKSLEVQVTSTIINYNKQNFNPCSTQEPNDIFENLVKIHPDLEKNKQFIKRLSLNYFCNICQKQINYSKKIDILIMHFKSHFKSNQHKRAMELLVNKEKEVVKKIDVAQAKSHSEISHVTISDLRERDVKEIIQQFSKQFPLLVLNENYLKEIDGNLFCKVCQKSFQFSCKGINEHTSSISHNTKLKLNISVYMSQLKYKLYVPNSVQTKENFHEVLDEIGKIQCLKPHIQCILFDYKNFICFLCNQTISFSKCGTTVMDHIFSSIHIENAYRINTVKKYN